MVCDSAKQKFTQNISQIEGITYTIRQRPLKCTYLMRELNARVCFFSKKEIQRARITNNKIWNYNPLALAKDKSIYGTY